MANTPNKVKYGLENVVYAKKTVSEAGEITYATPVKIPGAVNLSMDAKCKLFQLCISILDQYAVIVLGLIQDVHGK